MQKKAVQNCYPCLIFIEIISSRDREVRTFIQTIFLTKRKFRTFAQTIFPTKRKVRTFIQTIFPTKQEVHSERTKAALVHIKMSPVHPTDSDQNMHTILFYLFSL